VKRVAEETGGANAPEALPNKVPNESLSTRACQVKEGLADITVTI